MFINAWWGLKGESKEDGARQQEFLSDPQWQEVRKWVQAKTHKIPTNHYRYVPFSLFTLKIVKHWNKAA